MLNRGLLTSNKQDWETPQELFDRYNMLFPFVIDLAASDHNALTPIYYTEEINALKQNWHDIGGWCWLNPPYGRGLKEWVRKAAEEVKLGAKIVMLIPARTDTSYWHDYIFGNQDCMVDFLRGRLKFSGSKNSAPFPSAVVIWEAI